MAPTIIDGKESKLWWNAGDKGTRKRKSNEPIKSVVWHWTAGEGSASRIYNVLKNHKDRKTGKPSPLSIHFTIDAKGVITQHCDPASTIASHASAMNANAIGVEIANVATTSKSNPNGRLPRECVIRGQKEKFFDFLPAQYDAIFYLASYLNAMYGIQKEVLKETRQYDLSFLKTYNGHMEHLHCHKNKPDSGGFVMDFLAKHWNI